MHDDEMWQAFVARDAAYDGQFVVAVRTTGIYCRPSCAARRPRRENVAFFSAPVAAEQAGFRPCRRCRPADLLTSPQAAWVEQACRLIEARADQPPSLADLAAELGLSASHVQRVFKQVMGVSPRQYAEACRVKRVKATLKQEDTVTMALYEAGYGSSSRLYEQANGHLGMTPGAFKRGGAGVTVRYTIVSSKLGRVLVAGTERGLCFVSLGDDDAALEAALRHDYPAATLARDDDGLRGWASEILRFLDGAQARLDLPLDVQATAFQWRVWEALRAIPYGETRTYREIARSLDNPQAARAVGRACATNPVALVIPCHRAVREDGALGGYRWGLDKKEALLTQERARSETSAR